MGTEHILLGLLREEDGLASKVLCELLGRVDSEEAAEKIREAVVRIVSKGEQPYDGQIPFTPRAKKILELSLREALGLGHNYIGTEHILLGLIRENEGVAARILRDDLQISFETIRNEVIRQLMPGRKKGTVELQEKLEAKRAEKEAAIEAQEYSRASKLRDEERALANELRGRIPEPTTQDLLPGLRGTSKLIGGGKVKAQIIDGPLITGDVVSLTFGGITDTLVIADKKVEHKIPLGRLQSLTLC